MNKHIFTGVVAAIALVVTATPAAAADPVVSNSPIVGISATPAAAGYWQVASDGGVFSFGDARFFGSMGGKRITSPVVGMAATPSGGGYWLVASDGGIFSFGDAKFAGSMGGQRIAAPVVGMAATPSGNGYWLVASDGGIFSFGDAKFAGSMGGKRMAAPVVGMARTPSGGGYWLTGADGGVFTFGDAKFAGSAGGLKLAQPVSGLAATKGGGYWLTAKDGGLFSYGDAAFAGHAVYTGSTSGGTTSTAAQLAQGLLAGGATLATRHAVTPADNATARQNVVDTAAGNAAARSCHKTAPCGTIRLKVTMLQALLQISQGRAVRVSEIAGAEHSRTSLHYQGTAFDIDLINGTGGAGNTIGHDLADPIVAICRAQGAQEAFLELATGGVAGGGSKGNHVHCGWAPSVA